MENVDSSVKADAKRDGYFGICDWRELKINRIMLYGIKQGYNIKERKQSK